jgi:hypothetical protein
MSFNEWRSMIERAYEQAPRSYQEAYADFLRANLAKGQTFPDHAGLFLAGWLSACDALANRLVEWLDAPAGDDVAAFLGFVEELRRGNLESD